MSLNSLKIATGGYLKRTSKAVLIIAVAGYLNYGGTPPTPPEPHGGGNGKYKESFYDKDKEQREKILIEDSEIVAIVELTLKNFII